MLCFANVCGAGLCVAKNTHTKWVRSAHLLDRECFKYTRAETALPLVSQSEKHTFSYTDLIQRSRRRGRCPSHENIEGSVHIQRIQDIFFDPPRQSCNAQRKHYARSLASASQSRATPAFCHLKRARERSRRRHHYGRWRRRRPRCCVDNVMSI